MQRHHSDLLKKKRVLIAAGGSGGHLFPAQELGHLLREVGIGFCFVGKDLGKNPFFDRSKFPFKDIHSASPVEGSLWKKMYSLGILFLGLLESIFFLLRNRPDIVIGFGSFHAFPLLLACRLLSIPFGLFEADCSLGKVNRFFVKWADFVAVQFSKAFSPPLSHMISVPLLPWSFRKQKIDRKEARKKLSLQEELFTFLVFGGSQGAKEVNDRFLKAVEELKKKKMAFQVIHLTGSEEERKRASHIYEKLKIVHYVRRFEKEMALLFSSADLAICRAGASTLAELIFFSLPSILLSYPHAGNHQEKNADFMEKIVGGGIKFLATQQPLIEEIFSLLKGDKLASLRTSLEKFSLQESLQKKPSLVDLILGDILKR